MHFHFFKELPFLFVVRALEVSSLCKFQCVILLLTVAMLCISSLSYITAALYSDQHLPVSSTFSPLVIVIPLFASVSSTLQSPHISEIMQYFSSMSVSFHIVFIHLVAYGRMRLFINDFSILAPYIIENSKPFNVKFIAHYLLAFKTI